MKKHAVKTTLALCSKKYLCCSLLYFQSFQLKEAKIAGSSPHQKYSLQQSSKTDWNSVLSNWIAQKIIFQSVTAFYIRLIPTDMFDWHSFSFCVFIWRIDGAFCLLKIRCDAIHGWSLYIDVTGVTMMIFGQIEIIQKLSDVLDVFIYGIIF